MQPYLFVPSIDGDTSVGRIEGAEVEVGPVDLLENLDIGAMIQLEAHHKSGFGVTVGYNFMDLSGGASHPSGMADFDVEIFQGVFEGFGTYRIDTKDEPFDLYGGVRWTPQVSENWGVILNGDVGGFGVSSDFIWNVQAGVSWHSTNYLSIVCLYHALSVDYSTGTIGTPERFAYDTITHGPLLGLVFRL